MILIFLNLAPFCQSVNSVNDKAEILRLQQNAVVKNASLQCKVSSMKAPQTVSSSELMQIMTDNKIRHVVIMDDNILQGIVSIGDVVKRLLEKLEDEAEQLRLIINSWN